jgi:hypothetical protein
MSVKIASPFPNSQRHLPIVPTVTVWPFRHQGDQDRRYRPQQRRDAKGRHLLPRLDPPELSAMRIAPRAVLELVLLFLIDAIFVAL